MALSRFVVTANTTVAAGTVITTPTAGEPGTGGAAGYGSQAISAGAEEWPATFIEGTAIVLDTGSALFAALNGAGALRAYVQGQDDVGHAALAN